MIYGSYVIYTFNMTFYNAKSTSPSFITIPTKLFNNKQHLCSFIYEDIQTFDKPYAGIKACSQSV